MSTYTNARQLRSPLEANGIRFAYGLARTAVPDSRRFRSFSSGFAEYIGQHSKTREDIKTWFDALDLDDFVSFGGKA